MDSILNLIFDNAAELGFAFLVLGALAHVFFPRFFWYYHVGWRFRGGDVEPSDMYLMFTRIGGIVTVVVALLVAHNLTSCDVYQGALARVKNSPAVLEALGSPVKAKILTSGSISSSGSSGSATFRFPVSGPKGAANVEVLARKSRDEWHYSRLLVITKGKNRRWINLSEPGVFGEMVATAPSVSAEKPVAPAVKDPELDRLLAKAQKQYEQLSLERSKLDLKNEPEVKAFNQRAASYSELLASIEQRRQKSSAQAIQ